MIISSLRRSGGPLRRALGSAADTVLLCSVNEETAVATLTLNRPKAFNALNAEVVIALRDQYKALENDPRVRCLVLTGSEKAFAAGADIKEMLHMDYTAMETHDRSESLLQMSTLECWKPVVGAVNGFVLGGGCELAMTCDILIAGQNAKFGQPEVNLGIMAGAGGTQRLAAAVGKSLAMQMNLTGEPIDAERALAAGLVSEVVPTEECVERAQAVAATIASKSSSAVRKIKDAVNKNAEMTLSEGINYEHRSFVSCWATEDQSEGMAAFAEKRKAEWKHR